RSLVRSVGAYIGGSCSAVGDVELTYYKPAPTPPEAGALRTVRPLPYLGLSKLRCPRHRGSQLGHMATPPPDGLAMATLRRIAGLLRPYWRRALLALALGLAMQAITTVVPRIIRTVIDQGLTRRVPGVLGKELVLLLAL